MHSLTNSPNDNYGSGSDEDNDYTKIYILDIVMLLVILSMCVGVCLFMWISNLVDKCKRKKKIKTKIHRDDDIINNKLTNKYINRLNTENKKTIEIETNCPICFDSIYTVKKKTLIYLNCSHIFHNNCLQEWVKTQSKNNNVINCPLCRDNIIKRIPNRTDNQIVYDSDNESLSDLFD